MATVITLWKVLIFIYGAHSVCSSNSVYIKPTSPPNDCPHESYCYTVDEWMENGTNSFANGSSVMLLPGLHLINSTTHEMAIENIHSFTFTGDHEQEGTVTTLSCIGGFRFEFKICRNIKFSHITLQSCTIVFSYIEEDINISSITVVGGGLEIYHYVPDAHGYGSVYKFSKINCEVLAKVYIANNVFQNSIIQLKVEGKHSEASCIHLDIRNTVIKDIDREDAEHALDIHDIYSMVINNVTFLNNSSPSGLYIRLAHKATLSNITFWNNSPPMLRLNKIREAIFKGVLSFIRNRGPGYHGASMVSVEHITMDESFKPTRIEFCDNHIVEQLLYICCTKLVWLTFVTMTFVNNTSEQGGILTLDEAYLKSTYSSVIFQNNTSVQSEIRSAILLLEKTRVELDFDSQMVFMHNSALLSGGATLLGSSISFEDSTMRFEGNEGGDGGAMAFYSKSFVMTSGAGHNETILSFNNNHARNRGGAIFIRDVDYINSLTRIQDEYFIHRPTIQASLISDSKHVIKTIKFDLSSNTARVSGNDVYGGWIDSDFISYWGHISSEGFESGDHHNAIASDPTRICMCVESVPLCNVTEHQTKVFPGQTFEIEAVAVGQRMGIVPATVIIQLSDKEGRLDTGQNIQSVNRHCSPLHLRVFSEKRFVTLDLMAQNDGAPHHDYIKDWLSLEYHVVFSQLVINVTLNMCPLGFKYKKEFQRCLCLETIDLHNGVSCDYDTFSIVRTKRNWLFATREDYNTGVIIHDQCPYDYCRGDPDSLSFHLEVPDYQCAFNRSGVLCGACKQNLSQVFGTSRCTKCSNFMALALTPGSIIAGILLVGFLMLFDLTVSTGTINGLLFYATIIRESQSILFPPEISTSFLSTFIAWLNLDLGIETCFYNSLDAYAKAWLQFVFPLYIWLMVITIIIASHYSTLVSRLTPNNALQVLATLFLMSYAKILRIVIIVFSSTILIYPNDFKQRVWLYDGNIEFLTGKHIPLFIVTFLLLILLSFPYTLSLVSIQWLQRISHYRLLSWVHRLMPLFDAYTGPYKHKHRYWTGLLLLIRVMILTIFSLNHDNNPSLNLLAIAVIAFSLQTYTSFVRVYKNLIHNILEITSLTNIGFLAVATLYQLLNDKSVIMTTTISTSIAFVVFILLTLYHAVRRVLSLRKVRDTKSKLATNIASLVKVKGVGRGGEPRGNQVCFQEVTHSSIELHEKLISEGEQDKND